MKLAPSAVLLGSVLSLVTGLAPGLALAGPGEDVLARVDAAMNRAKDQSLVFDVVDQAPGKSERRLGIDVKVKGDLRLTRFTAPADLAGTQVLILSQTQMYVYLPAFKKVRRVASHVTKQGFMGTTYSNDDMALSRFSDKYTAKILSEDEDAWTLEATGKPDSEAPYPKLQLVVSKKHHMPTRLEYFNLEGDKTKTETRDDYRCQGDVCNAQLQKMVDHTAAGHWTKLILTDWKVNTGLPDRLFTKRTLQRGQ